MSGIFNQIDVSPLTRQAFNWIYERTDKESFSTEEKKQQAFQYRQQELQQKIAEEKGIDINTLGKRLSFFFNAHNNLFEEVSKFRAARKMWAIIMKSLGATDPKAMMLRFHTQTAGVSLTAQQPEVNIVRTAIEALAGVLGGTQSLHTNSMDEAMALPTERAARIALRTQQVIANETNVTAVADPLGGSWYVEELTNEMERRAEEIFADIEAFGNGSMLDGCINGIEENWFQSRIADSAYDLERKFNSGERIIVGVSHFLEGNDEEEIDLLRITNEDEQKQRRRLEAVRSSRNSAAVVESLAVLETEAADPEINLMPALINASNAQATVGEMMKSMGTVFGRHIEVPTI